MIEDRHNMGGLESMDSMDMPLTPASFAGLDHKVIVVKKTLKNLNGF